MLVSRKAFYIGCSPEILDPENPSIEKPWVRRRPAPAGPDLPGPARAAPPPHAAAAPHAPPHAAARARLLRGGARVRARGPRRARRRAAGARAAPPCTPSSERLHVQRLWERTAHRSHNLWLQQGKLLAPSCVPSTQYGPRWLSALVATRSGQQEER